MPTFIYCFKHIFNSETSIKITRLHSAARLSSLFLEQEKKNTQTNLPFFGIQVQICSNKSLLSSSGVAYFVIQFAHLASLSLFLLRSPSFPFDNISRQFWVCGFGRLFLPYWKWYMTLVWCAFIILWMALFTQQCEAHPKISAPGILIHAWIRTSEMISNLIVTRIRPSSLSLIWGADGCQCAPVSLKNALNTPKKNI